MTKRKDGASGFLQEAERIEREEIQVTDERAGGRWVFVRPRPPKEPSQVYSVRLPATVVEELRVLASASGEAPTALLRRWVLERMDQEGTPLPERKQRSSARGTGSAGTRKSTAARSAAKKRSGASARSEAAARVARKRR